MNAIPTIKDRADLIYRKLGMAKAMLRSIGAVDFDDDDLTKGIEEMLSDATDQAFEITNSPAAHIPAPEMDDRPGVEQPLPPLDDRNREKIRNLLTLIRTSACGFANDAGDDDEGAEVCLAIGAAADEAIALVYPPKRACVGAE